jgi:hypothetical protein
VYLAYNFTFLKSFGLTGYVTDYLLCCFHDLHSRVSNLAIHLRLMPSLGTCGAILPLIYMAQCSFIFTIDLLVIAINYLMMKLWIVLILWLFDYD